MQASQSTNNRLVRYLKRTLRKKHLNPIWVIGPPRARTTWALKWFQYARGYQIFNHPPWIQHEPFDLRYTGTCSEAFVEHVNAVLGAGDTPVILRHEVAFAKELVAKHWPSSRFIIVAREIFEWITSVRHFDKGLQFFYGSEYPPPSYVGHELPAEWWERAEWWQRAVAHYWAFLGAARENVDGYDVIEFMSSNAMTGADLARQLEGTWAGIAVSSLHDFQPSELTLDPDFTRDNVREVLGELNERGPWRLDADGLLSD